MFHKPVYTMDKDVPIEIRKAVGEHGNAAPLGFREVAWGEYAKHASSVVVEWHVFKQITPLGGWAKDLGHQLGHKRAVSVTLSVFRDGTGVGTEFEWDGKAYIPHYYRFGCDHKWEEKNVGQCLTKSTCMICGTKKVVDSSG